MPLKVMVMSVDPLAGTLENIGRSSYHYVWNNPMKFIDPDGRAALYALGGNTIKGFFKAAGAYILGVANAVGSNSLLGAGRQDPSTFGEYASWAQAGLTSGDVISTVQGGAQMLSGTVSSLVVTSTGIGVVATPASVGLAVHGATTSAKGIDNLLNPSKLEANSKSDLPQPSSGKGSVSPSQRDPKRAFSPKQKNEMLVKQEGKCLGCEKTSM